MARRHCWKTRPWGDQTFIQVQDYCKQFVAAQTSMLELCVSNGFNRVLPWRIDTTEQNWEESPFLHTTVPFSSQVIRVFKVYCATMCRTCAHVCVVAVSWRPECIKKSKNCRGHRNREKHRNLWREQLKRFDDLQLQTGCHSDSSEHEQHLRVKIQLLVQMNHCGSAIQTKLQTKPVGISTLHSGSFGC